MCHFSGRLLGRFLLLVLPAFLVGGLGVAPFSGWLLFPWLAAILAYFRLVEIRVLSSHCPHYAEPSMRLLRCWADYGSPKLWAFLPGPMGTGERLALFAGLALIAGYPLAILVAPGQWFLLASFVLVVALTGILMSRWMCSRCMNFACPLNRVDPETRGAFLACNPVIDCACRQRRYPST